MANVFTKEWFQCAAVRALKTVAQTAVGVIGASTMMDSVSWGVVISSALLAGVVSMLTSIAGLPECGTKEET